MKYFKNSDGEVYAYTANGTQDEYIRPNLIPITEAEADELRGSYAIKETVLGTTDELMAQLRAARNMAISDIRWILERHTDEIMMGKETTLTTEQYFKVLTYIQDLRDLPAQDGSPWDGGGDETPWPAPPEV